MCEKDRGSGLGGFIWPAPAGGVAGNPEKQALQEPVGSQGSHTSGLMARAGAHGRGLDNNAK